MRHLLLRFVVLCVVISVLGTGCILTRGVDRAFLGASYSRAAYQDRMTTGLFLLPPAFALDVVTFPIQAVLLIIFGDDWPYKDSHLAALDNNPQFQKLADGQKALALAELKRLMRSGAASPNNAFVLGQDGRWVVVKINTEARNILLSRIQAPASHIALAAAH